MVGFQRSLLGLVSLQPATHSPIPVAAIPPSARLHGALGRIVVDVDASPNSRAALGRSLSSTTAAMTIEANLASTILGSVSNTVPHHSHLQSSSCRHPDRGEAQGTQSHHPNTRWAVGAYDASRPAPSLADMAAPTLILQQSFIDRDGALERSALDSLRCRRLTVAASGRVRLDQAPNARCTTRSLGTGTSRRGRPGRYPIRLPREQEPVHRFRSILFSPLADRDNPAAARRISDLAARNAATLTVLARRPTCRGCSVRCTVPTTSTPSERPTAKRWQPSSSLRPQRRGHRSRDHDRDR